MQEDFDPRSEIKNGAVFDCEMADDTNIQMRAKKSKLKVIVDPSKCQIFSLANLMTNNEQLKLPEKRPGAFPNP